MCGQKYVAFVRLERDNGNILSVAVDNELKVEIRCSGERVELQFKTPDSEGEISLALQLIDKIFAY